MLTTLSHIIGIKIIESVVNNLEHSPILFKWLNVSMTVNTGKSHLLVSGNIRAMAKIDKN